MVRCSLNDTWPCGNSEFCLQPLHSLLNEQDGNQHAEQLPTEGCEPVNVPAQQASDEIPDCTASSGLPATQRQPEVLMPPLPEPFCDATSVALRSVMGLDAKPADQGHVSSWVKQLHTPAG